MLVKLVLGKHSCVFSSPFAYTFLSLMEGLREVIEKRNRRDEALCHATSEEEKKKKEEEEKSREEREKETEKRKRRERERN